MNKKSNIFVLALLATTVAAKAQTLEPAPGSIATRGPSNGGSVDITAKGPNGKSAGSASIATTKNGVDFNFDSKGGDVSIDVTKGKGSFDIATTDNGKPLGKVDVTTGKNGIDIATYQGGKQVSNFDVPTPGSGIGKSAVAVDVIIDSGNKPIPLTTLLPPGTGGKVLYSAGSQGDLMLFGGVGTGSVGFHGGNGAPVMLSPSPTSHPGIADTRVNAGESASLKPTKIR